VAEEATGQEVTQPTIPESLNPAEAIGILAQALEAEGKPEAPRNEKGQFKSEAKTEEAKPETEAPEVKAEEPKPEEEQPEITPEPRKFKLRYKGEEREVDEPEAIELAQKGFDYTQKSQALAKEREELGAKVKAEQETQRTAYEQRLELHKQAVLALSGVKSMAQIEELAKTDPAGAQQEFLRAIAVNQRVQAIEAEQQNIANQKKAEAQESFTKQARETVEKLQERIPGWNNDLYGKILKGAVDQYGFDAKDVNAINDHRAIKVLNDALKWREYQSAKPKTVEKRVAQVPKVQKPGTVEKTNPDADRFGKSMARLEKTGKRDDAVDAVRMLIEAGKL
jgi:hypothetical protein